MIDLKIKLKKTVLKNPFILLSGTVSVKTLSFLQTEDVGAVVLKTVTLNPREPNPAPRMFDAGIGVINSIGLFNQGIKCFLKSEYPEYKKLGFSYVLSVGEFTEETFIEALGKIKKIAQTDESILGIELNFSCPNVKESGLAFSRNPKVLKRITKFGSDEFDKEVWVKLSPVSPLKEQIEAAEDGGATALTIANTMPATGYNLGEKSLAIGAGEGGLSGPALKPINLNYVRLAAKMTGLPIIASGGIGTIEDVLEYALAGARVFGFGTVLFKDPRTPKFVKNDLIDYLQDSNYERYEDLSKAFREKAT